MNEHPVNEALPEPVLKALTVLERWTGRMPLAHAVTAITVTGLVLTTLVVSAVAWGERHRQHSEFESLVNRYQMVAQARLDHHQALLDQVGHWASEQARLSGTQSGTWSAAGVTVLRPQDLDADMLSARLDLDDARSGALVDCLKQAPAGRVRVLCALPPAPEQERGWLMAVRVAPPGQGWVMAPFWARQLLDVEASDLALRLQASLDDAPATARPDAVDGLASTVTLHVASDALRLRVHAEVTPLSWRERVSRQAGIGVAALAGLLFTLAALHLYLMLISTRRRAREMSRDMGLALHRTQTRNQAVMDTAPDAILMVDGEGRVRWCNQATTSIFGLTSDDLLGRQLGTVLPSLGEGGMHDWFATCGFSNRVIGYEATGLRNEGVSFPVAVSASRAEVEGELIQTFIVRDTTDAKWAEQELLLRDRALASSADGVVIVSMTLPNQPMIYVNHAFEHITGYEGHELLGVNCRVFQRDDQQQPGIAVMRDAIREGRSCQVVLRNYRKDGTLFYNDLAISPVLGVDGNLTHFVGVATDITDRIAAEQVLQLRTERLNAVFDLSPDGFVVLDKRGEVSIVNPAFERMTGLLAADLVGQSQSALEEHLMERCKSREVDEQDPAAGASAARELLHMHTPSVRTLLRRVRHGGQDNETVMYFRDITHEQEVDRMKSEFLAMAAHELRTPMVSIFGFTELLLKRSFTDERRNDMLSTIHRQASVLINLVNELLDLARIESRRGKDFKRERQLLQPLIENTVAGLLMHNDPRKVDVSLPSERIVVDVDKEKLSLALTNVLSNAHKYSPQGGDIGLDLVWRDRDGRTECGIRVTDQGQGMTPEQQAKVFDRFFRADTSGNIPGTGLGMTIVKEIIELHGGQVGISSEWGVGTTVILWIPAIEATADPASAPVPSADPDTVTQAAAVT
ncbi:MAG: PAS domain S-box protein [Burkholderiales bacterium]|nr:PAS domain S-box protein [Burkholderiales bacterium]MBH2015185.1 PAS domain S-box protein [Burkholderiales bacterium]